MKLLTELSRRLRRRTQSLSIRRQDRLTVRCHGRLLSFSIRSRTAKDWFLPRYADGAVHEPRVVARLRSWLAPDSVFFDIGANVGFFTVFAANLCSDREGSVHAFEMDPSLVSLIEESLRLNADLGRVYLNSAACADTDGGIHRFRAEQIGNPSTNRLLATGEDAPVGAIVRQVSSLTLDSYCRELRIKPHVVKMDIEGGEALAVPGMLETVRTARPNLILEVHPQEIRRHGEDPEDLVRTVQREGAYRTEVLPSYRTPLETGEEMGAPFTSGALSGSGPVVISFEARPG